jgi:predicted RNase H-like HicB family nuclease
MKPPYSMVIQWSIEDEIYIVSLPEFGDRVHTHGDTYAEAIQHGEEVLELLIEEYQIQGRALPQPIAAGTPIAIGVATSLHN